MLNIPYVGCLGLSPAISSQFTLKRCSQKCEKKLSTVLTGCNKQCSQSKALCILLKKVAKLYNNSLTVNN